jgi:hypothetical protein
LCRNPTGYHGNVIFQHRVFSVHGIIDTMIT